MAVDTNRLREFMERYFGSMGDFLLAKEMKQLGITDLNTADPGTRRRLAGSIVYDCLSTIMSASRMRLANTELESILDVTTTPIEGAITKSTAIVNMQ
jgi:hypothetical protein